MKLVVFDLGGVLVRITLNVREAAALAGVSVNPKPGIESFVHLPPIFFQYQKGEGTREQYFSEMAECFGCSAEEAFLVHHAILVEPYDGTLELIRTIHGAGMHTAILSNTNAVHWEEMANSARWPNFAAIEMPLGSHELRLEKPSAEAFQAVMDLASERFGMELERSDVIFFDDSVGNVEGAKAFGWNSHLVDHTGDTAAQMRGRLFPATP